VARGNEEWLDRLETDHDNLRLAVTHLLERARIADALRTCTALWRFWDVRSFAREGLDLLRAASDAATDEVSAPLRLTALFCAGVLADSCSDLEQARHFFERHLALTTEQGEPAAIGIANSNVGIIKMRLGNVADAIPLLEAAVHAMRDVKNPQALAMALANVGNAERVRRNFDAARARYAEAKEIFERIGDRVNVGWSMSHLGDLARDEGKVDEARASYRESVDIFGSLRHKRGLTSVLTDLGELLATQGMTLDARGCLEEALVQVADVGDQRAMLRVFEVFAMIASAQQEDDRAVRIAGAVAGLRDHLGAPLSAADRQRLQDRIASSLVRMEAASRDRAWRDGVAMSIEEVITYVTTVTVPPAVTAQAAAGATIV
jgi:tetratricopeptide (TPR) repeat protein